MLNIGVKEYGSVSQNKPLVCNVSFYSECVSSSILVPINNEFKLFYQITLQLFNF